MQKETYYGLNRKNEDHMDRLKVVLSLQDEPRWRAAANLYLYLNPKSYALDHENKKVVEQMDARTEARIIAEECAQLRKAYAESGNEGAVSKGSTAKGDEQTAHRVYALRMPATMLQFIQMIDPELTETTRGEDGRVKWRKLTREFKEFRIAV
jgi:hypothetical protein